MRAYRNEVEGWDRPQLGGGGGKILLLDNAGDRAVMLRPKSFQCLGVWISVALPYIYVSAQLIICNVISDFPADVPESNYCVGRWGGGCMYFWMYVYLCKQRSNRKGQLKLKHFRHYRKCLFRISGRTHIILIRSRFSLVPRKFGNSAQNQTTTTSFYTASSSSFTNHSITDSMTRLNGGFVEQTRQALYV